MKRKTSTDTSGPSTLKRPAHKGATSATLTSTSRPSTTVLDFGTCPCNVPGCLRTVICSSSGVCTTHRHCTVRESCEMELLGAEQWWFFEGVELNCRCVRRTTHWQGGVCTSEEWENMLSAKTSRGRTDLRATFPGIERRLWHRLAACFLHHFPCNAPGCKCIGDKAFGTQDDLDAHKRTKHSTLRTAAATSHAFLAFRWSDFDALVKDRKEDVDHNTDEGADRLDWRLLCVRHESANRGQGRSVADFRLAQREAKATAKAKAKPMPKAKPKAM